MGQSHLQEGERWAPHSEGLTGGANCSEVRRHGEPMRRVHSGGGGRAAMAAPPAQAQAKYSTGMPGRVGALG